MRGSGKLTKPLNYELKHVRALTKPEKAGLKHAGFRQLDEYLKKERRDYNDKFPGNSALIEPQ